MIAGDSIDDGLTVHLKQRQEAVAMHHATLEQAVEALGEQASLGERVAIEYGLSLARAELDWIAVKLAQLSVDQSEAVGR
jgi:hypothetical protein